MLPDFNELCHEYWKDSELTIASKLFVKLQSGRGPSRPLEVLLFNIMHIIDYNSREKRRQWDEKVASLQKGQILVRRRQ